MASGLLPWQSSFNLTDTGDLGATLQHAAVLFNFSLHHAVMVLREHERRDAVFDSTTEGALIAAYAVVVATGVASNLLVAGVILSRSRVRTPRNVFLLNLNASDLVLCLVCVPFTLLELLRRHWPLGGALCRLLPFLQCASIFASSASVAIIAIDRQRCVLSTCAERRVQGAGHSHNYSRKYRLCRWRKGRRVIQQTLIVWTTACLLSLPNCFSRHAQVAQLSGLAVYTRCVERWPHRYGKQAYTLLVLLAQFLIPVAVLTVAHLRIKAHLGLTSVANVKTGSSTSVQSNADRLQKELARNRRATFILFAVSAVYAISWLPWNALNLAADLAPTLLSPRGLYLSFGVCHLVAMTSATTNPFLYGWLNTNIKKELMEVGERVLSSHRSTLTDTNNQQQQETLSEANADLRRIKSADPSYVSQNSDSEVSRKDEAPSEGGNHRGEKGGKKTPIRKFYSLKINKRDKNSKKLRTFSLEYRGLREQQNRTASHFSPKLHSLISKDTELTESSSSLTEGRQAGPTSPPNLRRFLTQMRTSSKEYGESGTLEFKSMKFNFENESKITRRQSTESAFSVKAEVGSVTVDSKDTEPIDSAIYLTNESVESSKSDESYAESDGNIEISLLNDSTAAANLRPAISEAEKRKMVNKCSEEIVSPLRNLSSVQANLWQAGDIKAYSLEALDGKLFPKSQRHLVIHCPRDLTEYLKSKNSREEIATRIAPTEKEKLNQNDRTPGPFLIDRSAELEEVDPLFGFRHSSRGQETSEIEPFHLSRIFSLRLVKERGNSKRSSRGLSAEANF